MTLACAAIGSPLFWAGAYDPGTGDGLSGAYWKGATNFDKDEPELFWGKRPQGTHATKMFDRVDKVIDFEWGDANPFDDTTTDFPWSIEWTGYVLAPVTSLYTFDMTHWDDGFYFAIYDLSNLDEPIAKNEFWGTDFKWDQPDWQAEVDLTGGKYYRIVLRHYENEFGAHAKFQWFIWEESTTTTVVPQSQLYSKLPGGAGLENIAARSISFAAVGNQIQINGLKGEAVTCYSVYGQEVLADENVEGCISFELPKGVYIVKAGTETRKVVIR